MNTNKLNRRKLLFAGIPLGAGALAVTKTAAAMPGDAPVSETAGSIAQLKAIVPGGGITICAVQGYHSPGDGGGGLFAWRATSKLPGNDGTVIIPDKWLDGFNNPREGRWIRLS